MISAHNCDYRKYADDTELSKSAQPNQFTAVLSCIHICIDDVELWMNSNKLKLNSDKIEVMPVGSDLVLSRSAVSAQTQSIWRASFLELRRIASVRL